MGKYSEQNPMDIEYESSNSNSQQRLRHRVEVQSMHIEQILARHQINAEVNGGSIRPGWIDFDIQAQLAGGWQKFRQLTDELVAALNVPEVKIERQNGSLRLLVKKEVPHAVDLLDLNDATPGLLGVGVSLGVSEDGHPILLNLSSPDVNNLLITGVEGAGKSGLMRTFAISLSLANRQSEVQIGVITAGNDSRSFVTRPNPLYPMNYLPHLLFPVATSVEDAIAALEFLVDEINYRMENNIKIPLLVLLIDDVDWLLSQGDQAIFQPLAELLHVPADAGLRTILSAADINLGGLSRLLKHDSPMRFVGRVGNADQAFYLTGELDTGAENLNGRGDFLAVSYGSQIRFQAAYIDDYDLHLTLSKLHRPKGGILLARRRYGNGIHGLSIKDRTPVNFAYDSANGRATIENQTENETNNAPAIVLEQSKPERYFDGEVTDQTSLSPQIKSKDISEHEYDIPLIFDQPGKTSDELPGFLITKYPDQITDEIKTPEPDLIDQRQMELEYSDLDEDEDFDIDVEEDWQFPSLSESDGSEQGSKQIH